MKVALLSDTWCKNSKNNHVDCDWAFEQCPSGCEPKYVREKCTLNDGSKRGFIMFGCDKGRDLYIAMKLTPCSWLSF